MARKMEIGSDVFVTVIEHKHGTDLKVHADHDNAMEQVLAYVNEWWEVEAPSDVERPQERDELIETYFEVVDDEFVLIERTTLRE